MEKIEYYVLPWSKEEMKMEPQEQCKQFLEVHTPVSGNMNVRFVTCPNKELCIKAHCKKLCFLKSLEYHGNSIH